MNTPQDPIPLICERIDCPHWDGNEGCSEGLTPDYCEQLAAMREDEAKAWHESMKTGGME